MEVEEDSRRKVEGGGGRRKGGKGEKGQTQRSEEGEKEGGVRMGKEMEIGGKRRRGGRRRRRRRSSSRRERERGGNGSGSSSSSSGKEEEEKKRKKKATRIQDGDDGVESGDEDEEVKYDDEDDDEDEDVYLLSEKEDKLEEMIQQPQLEEEEDDDADVDSVKEDDKSEEMTRQPQLEEEQKLQQKRQSSGSSSPLSSLSSSSSSSEKPFPPDFFNWPTPSWDGNQMLIFDGLDPWVTDTSILFLFPPEFRPLVTSVALPWQEGARGNDGYAFIRFRTHAIAEAILQAYDGKHVPHTQMTLRVSWAPFHHLSHVVYDEHDCEEGEEEEEEDDDDEEEDEYKYVFNDEDEDEGQGQPPITQAEAGQGSDYREEEALSSDHDNDEQEQDEEEKDDKESDHGEDKESPSVVAVNGNLNPETWKSIDGIEGLHLPPQDDTLPEVLPVAYAHRGDTTILFVAGLDPALTEDGLRTMLSQFKPGLVRFFPGRACGFVEFASGMDADQAVRKMCVPLTLSRTCLLYWGLRKSSIKIEDVSGVPSEVGVMPTAWIKTEPPLLMS